MEYVCTTCDSIFGEPDYGRQTKSILVKSLILKCPYCGSTHIKLTERSLLLFNRKNKINKIEKNITDRTD